MCRSMGTKRRKMRTFKMRTHKSSDLCVEVWAQRGDKKRRRQKERKMKNGSNSILLLLYCAQRDENKKK